MREIRKQVGEGNIAMKGKLGKRNGKRSNV
jgi:hypothetical protein